MGRYTENQSRLWLRRCHRRQLPHTGVSARLEPLAFPYQHEPPPKNLAQKPASPTHQHRHRHRRPPSAFDPTTAAQPSRQEPLFMPRSCHTSLRPRPSPLRRKAVVYFPALFALAACVHALCAGAVSRSRFDPRGHAGVSD